MVKSLTTPKISIIIPYKIFHYHNYLFVARLFQILVNDQPATSTKQTIVSDQSKNVAFSNYL